MQLRILPLKRRFQGMRLASREWEYTACPYRSYLNYTGAVYSIQRQESFLSVEEFLDETMADTSEGGGGGEGENQALFAWHLQP